jgi:radical SAM protein with 4Fe4S-binding SPASM domain
MKTHTLLEKPAMFRPLPAVIRIEPASACNLRCSHCPTGTIDMPRGIMKPETFDLLLDQLKPHIPNIRIVVLYHGGEPLVNKHFASMVQKLKQAGVKKVKTVSNGMLLTESIAHNLVNSGLDMIEFSLDGQNEQENNEVRINSNFQQVVQNIHRLIKIKKETGQNRPEIFISTTQFITPEKLENQISAAAPSYILDAFKDCPDDIAGYKPTYAMVWPHISLNTDLYTTLVDDRPKKDVRSCSYTEETISVRANGDVVPCCYDLTSQLIMGNIHAQSLTEIWNGPQYRELYRQFRSREYNHVCQNCNVVRPEVYLMKTETPQLVEA